MLKASSSDIKIRGLELSSFACRFLVFGFYFFAQVFEGRNATLLSSLLPFAVGTLKHAHGLHNLLVDAETHLPL